MPYVNKYNRSSYYKLENVYGYKEYDIVNNNWNLFTLKRPVSYFTMTRGYIQRPDLLSIKLYGEMKYWWIIGKVNQIDDWWNDVVPDEVIAVPNKLDIEDFYLNVRSLTS